MTKIRRPPKPSNGAIAAFHVIVQTVALFCIYRLVAGKTNVSMLGIWSTAVSVMGIVSVADVGLSELLVRELSYAVANRNWMRAKGLYRSMLLLVATLVGLAGLAAIPPITLLLHSISPGSTRLTDLSLAFGAAGVVWLTTLGVGTTGLLEAFGRYDLKALASAVSGVVSIVITWLAVSSMPQSAIAVGLFSAAFINFGLSLAAGLVLLKHLPGKAVSPSRREIVGIFRIGLQVRLSGLATVGLEPATRFLVLKFGGSESSGFYEIACRLVTQLRAVLVAVTQVVVPRLSRERAQGLYDANEILVLTQSSLRLASPLLWTVLLMLPLLTILMIGHVNAEILNYGLMLSVAWLINFVAAPAYFGNFVEGRFLHNRLSHLLMLALVALVGPLAGSILGGSGVVAITSIAICCGSIYLLASRGEGAQRQPIGLGPVDYWIAGIGLLAAATVYLLAHSTISDIALQCTAVTVAITYASLVAWPFRKLAATHLQLLSRGPSKIIG